MVVEVVSLNDATVYSKSSTVTPIAIKGTLTLTAPTGGQTWAVGSTHNITWNYTGSIGTVELVYSTDGGGTYPGGNTITASTSVATGSYSWTIPDAVGNTVRVEVVDTSDATVYSASGSNFSINGSMAITAPLSGTVWIVGAQQNITWTKAGTFLAGNDVELQYSTNGGTSFPNVITASTAAGSTSGSYLWTIRTRSAEL